MKQIEAVPVPQLKEDIVEVLPRRVPQVMEEVMKVSQSVPFERIQKRVLVPHSTEDIVEVTQRVPQKRVPNPIVEQIGGVPVPPDQQECCGRKTRRITGVAEKAGPLGLAKKTRFAAEHWEGQVHWASVHCEDASSSW